MAVRDRADLRPTKGLELLAQLVHQCPERREPVDRVGVSPVSSAEPEEERDGGQPGPPCLRDPLSVDGLRRLGREDRLWRRGLRAFLRTPEFEELEKAAAQPQVTLRTMILVFCYPLLGGGLGRPSVETTYKARQLMRIVVEVAGDQVVHECELRREELRELLTRERSLSPDRASRAMRLVEGALIQRSLRTGFEMPPKEERVPAAPSKPRAGRWSLPLNDCEALMRAARPGERVKMGLVLGAGLLPGQVERLRGRDVTLYKITPQVGRAVGVPAGLRTAWFGVRLRGKKVRWVPANGWLFALVRQSRLGRGGERFVPASEAPSLAATLHRLGGPVLGREALTPSDLAVTWQAVTLGLGLSREVVRRSWSQPVGEPFWPNDWHRAQRGLMWLSQQWNTLDAPIVAPFMDRGFVVPRRAPSRCPADQPERGWRSPKRVTPPLPPGVLTGRRRGPRRR